MRVNCFTEPKVVDKNCIYCFQLRAMLQSIQLPRGSTSNVWWLIEYLQNTIFPVERRSFLMD